VTSAAAPSPTGGLPQQRRPNATDGGIFSEADEETGGWVALGPPHRPKTSGAHNTHTGAFTPSLALSVAK